MTLRNVLLAVTLVLTLSAAAAAQQQQGKEVHVAPNAPKDNPVDVQAEEARKFEEALKPHIKKAKDTFPDVRRRFHAGLPPKQSLFVTTRLRDDEGRFEQVFVAVDEIKGEVIKGRIWNDVRLVKGYKHGDVYSFPQGELLDWTITKPDGTEEGNFVGKFIESLQRGNN